MSLPSSGSIHLVGNIPPFTVVSSSGVRIRIWDTSVSDANLLYDETLYPDNGTVSLDVRRILFSAMDVSLPGTSDLFDQTNALKTFVYQAGTSSSQTSFKAVCGGIEGKSFNNHTESDAFTSSFLAGNFLSWQPQTKHISVSQPEYLTYLFASQRKLVARVYYASGASVAYQDVLLLNFIPTSSVPAIIKTVNVSYTKINSLLPNGIHPSYYDVFAADSSYTLDQASTSSGRVSYIQRYVAASPGERDQCYMWVNSIGGVDTVRCTGKLLYLPSHESELYSIDDVLQEGEPDVTTSWKQNTGFVESQNEGKWLSDFLISKKKYHLQGASLRRIVMETQDQEYDILSPGGFEFEYRYADQSVYCFVDRSQSLEMLSSLPDPSLFFLNNIRLADYPSASLNDGLLLAVQTAYGSEWKKLTIREISAYVNTLVTQGYLEEAPLQIQIDTDGDNFLAFGESVNVTCKVMKAWDDVTSRVTGWNIVRDSGDATNDAAWLLKQKVQSFAGTIEISHKQNDNDLATNTNVISTIFTITATLSSGDSVQSQLVV